MNVTDETCAECNAAGIVVPLVTDDPMDAAREARADLARAKVVMEAWKPYDEHGQAQSSAPIARYCNALRIAHRARYVCRKTHRAWFALNVEFARRRM